ncbi:hypothetical protein G3V96_25790, partial [Escherichia coli]|nr:hypothetical protein [Escherichia coli]
TLYGGHESLAALVLSELENWRDALIQKKQIAELLVNPKEAETAQTHLKALRALEDVARLDRTHEDLKAATSEVKTLWEKLKESDTTIRQQRVVIEQLTKEYDDSQLQIKDLQYKVDSLTRTIEETGRSESYKTLHERYLEQMEKRKVTETHLAEYKESAIRINTADIDAERSILDAVQSLNAALVHIRRI